ncbi:MAG: hypothetical protein ACFFD4_32265 [Candidatus Odinarchaeota archaeon]
MGIEGVIIFNSTSGVPLFSKVDKSINSTLFSAFMSAVRKFSSHLSLGGLSSFTTEEKTVFLAASSRVVTALITSGDLTHKNMYSIAYEICEEFEASYSVKIGKIAKLSEYSGFIDKLDKILNNNSFSVQDSGLSGEVYKPDVPVLPKPEIKVIYLYTVNKDGDLVTLDSDNKVDLSSYPLLVIVNTIIKQIYVLENSEDISSRLMFFAGRAATKLNNDKWKSEFQIRDISDHYDCTRLIEQVSSLIKECDLNQQE